MTKMLLARVTTEWKLNARVYKINFFLLEKKRKKKVINIITCSFC